MRALLLLLFLAALAAPAAAAPWRITRPAWTAADEAGFGRFVAALGESGCSSSESCLRSPANPWRDSDADFADIDVDCAKLPYLLRAYYAWKNGLPFSYVDGVRGGRFGGSANRIVSRAEILDRGAGIEAPRALHRMLDQVYTATYRTDASLSDGDFYSPALAPGSIRPGTVIYDTNAHVGIVYRVDAAGRVYYMDAHPDFTISRSVYGAQFGRSPMRLGGGLKNWRPFRLAGARREAGALLGGHYAFARNDQIADFSLVQYTGTEPDGSFAYNGAPLGFYEYARVAVSGGRTDLNPLYELRATMRGLCADLQDRRQAVEQATANGISARLHPAQIPADIYASDDTVWESYATAARDARLRAGFVQFRSDLARMIALWVARDPGIVYDGHFLKDDLLAAYDQESARCTVTYLSSDEHPVTLDFDALAGRLFAMSFDPYTCVELRWGETMAIADAQGCPDRAGKRRWYAQEEAARHEIGRDVPGSQVRSVGPADVDIRGLIAAMPARVPFVAYRPAQ